MRIPFRLPPPKGVNFDPEWDGSTFKLGEQHVSVLEYSENFSGWSDDLTALHEDVAGDDHPIDIASRSDAINQISKLKIANNSVIMEIGCSSGYFLKDLIKNFPEAVVIGADVVKQPLYNLAKTFHGIPLIRFDLLQCPLPEKIANVIVMLNVLEHIEDDFGALKKVFHMLKPGGALVLEVPAGKQLYDSYDEELQHFRRYSHADLITKLDKAGFNIVRKSHLGFFVFPGFALVKLKNKIFKKNKVDSIVRSQVGKTSNNNLVRGLMSFELKKMGNLCLPFGIRALVVARRPE